MINKASVVQIMFGDHVVGAGFFVSSDGLVITCAHVMLKIGAKPGDEIKIRLLTKNRPICSAHILEDGWRDQEGDDLAFLKVNVPNDAKVECLLIDVSKDSSGNSFSSFGFPEMRDQQGLAPFDGTYAEGRITGEDLYRRNGQKALQLSSFELNLGFSGSPVYDESKDRVVGIITEARPDPLKKPQYVAWATPSENIVEAYPALEFLPAISKKLPPYAYSLTSAQNFVGRDDYLETLQNFWEKGQEGTLALIGIGGSGKTAITRQFLETKGWLNTQPPADMPDGLFIWSFYEQPETTTFLTEAYRYFSQTTALNSNAKFSDEERPANVFRLADILQKTGGRYLIVMDGLEKMQSDGGEGAGLARGSLIDPPLRHLLTRITDGVCGKTKAIVTSRFALTDLVDWKETKYCELDVDELSLVEAYVLLRKLKVHGADASLKLLFAEYGRHALTLDLLGKLLSEYYEGAWLKAFELPSLETTHGSEQVDRQASRLTRVLLGYEKRLRPEELEVLQYLSVFRRSVDFQFLKKILATASQMAIKENTRTLSDFELLACLKTLENVRLVEVEPGAGPSNPAQYTSHPAIRDHFYRRLYNAVNIHEVVRTQLITLVDAPGFVKPTNNRSIDLIEELVYHSTRAEKTSDAYKIYRERLGYRHLGWELGDHARGAGMMRLFEREGNSFGDISQSEWELLTIDHGLYLKNLGVLDDAITYLQKAVSTENSAGSNVDNLASAFQNLSAIQVMRGRLVDAEKSARAAVEAAAQSSDERLLQDCRVRLGTAYALQGKVDESISVFADIKRLTNKGRHKSLPRDLPGIRLGWLLLRLGKLAEAETELQETLEFSKEHNFPIIGSRSEVLLAELKFKQGNISDAQKDLENVFVWATNAYDQEMEVAANLLAGRIALATQDFEQATRYLKDGLRVAEECGHSLYWIDLKILQGRIYLRNDIAKAIDFAEKALNGQAADLKHPTILGAQLSECNYQWGKADALQLVGEAYIQKRDMSHAKKSLIECLSIRRTLSAPEIAETESYLAQC